MGRRIEGDVQRLDIIIGEGASGARGGMAAPSDGFLDALRAALHEAGVATHVRRPGVPGLPDEDAALAPAIVWQAQDDALARARLLAMGAGDVTGPWMHPAEALARALRLARPTRTAPPGTTLTLGDLEIDLIEREARRDGRTLGLLQREFELLHLLARRAGRPQSRETLLRDVWRLRFDPGTNVVEVHVSRLRAKLDRDYPWPMLRTVRGAGYALIPAMQSARRADAEIGDPICARS